MTPPDRLARRRYRQRPRSCRSPAGPTPRRDHSLLCWAAQASSPPPPITLTTTQRGTATPRYPRTCSGQHVAPSPAVSWCGHGFCSLSSSPAVHPERTADGPAFDFRDRQQRATALRRATLEDHFVTCLEVVSPHPCRRTDWDWSAPGSSSPSRWRRLRRHRPHERIRRHVGPTLSTLLFVASPC